LFEHFATTLWWQRSSTWLQAQLWLRTDAMVLLRPCGSLISIRLSTLGLRVSTIDWASRAGSGLFNANYYRPTILLRAVGDCAVTNNAVSDRVDLMAATQAKAIAIAEELFLATLAAAAVATQVAIRLVIQRSVQLSSLRRTVS
jgi:hypothetical protein